MESESSLPQSQVISTCPYPEPDQSRQYPQPISPISILILSIHLCLGLPSYFFPCSVPCNSLYVFFFSSLSCYVTRPAQPLSLYQSLSVCNTHTHTHTSTGETRHPHHNKIIQGAAPKREKIASSRLLQYTQHKHLKMADWGRNM
jgi:hypothetical protein